MGYFPSFSPCFVFVKVTSNNGPSHSNVVGVFLQQIQSISNLKTKLDKFNFFIKNRKLGNKIQYFLNLIKILGKKTQCGVFTSTEKNSTYLTQKLAVFLCLPRSRHSQVLQILEKTGTIIF